MEETEKAIQNWLDSLRDPLKLGEDDFLYFHILRIKGLPKMSCGYVGVVTDSQNWQIVLEVTCQSLRAVEILRTLVTFFGQLRPNSQWTTEGEIFPNSLGASIQLTFWEEVECTVTIPYP